MLWTLVAIIVVLASIVHSTFHPFNQWPLYQVDHQEYYCETNVTISSNLICCQKLCFDSSEKNNLTAYHFDCKVSFPSLNITRVDNATRADQIKEWTRKTNCTNEGFNERAYFDKRNKEEESGKKGTHPILQRVHDQAKWHFRLFFIWMQRKLYKFLAMNIFPKGFLAG